MKIYNRVIGSLYAPDWAERAAVCRVDNIVLDQWTAQKSRFSAAGSDGRDYAVALERNTRLHDGDILEYDAAERRIVAVSIELNDVMVADLSDLQSESIGHAVRIAVELGHAIGNQHWPAVVKGLHVYIPLTVDRKVMRSVMQTHRLEGVTYEFRHGSEVIPYLAPHEIRRLFGGAERSSDGMHHSHLHPHTHEHDCLPNAK